ncbi:MAG: general secretion pathway protein D [Verrucomicrobiales bacterium]|jgi:general secretion pathway protein D
MLPKNINTRRVKRARLAAWFCAFGLCTGLSGNAVAQEPNGGSGETVASTVSGLGVGNVTQRQDQMRRIQKKLILGDQRHANRDFGGALDLYREGFTSAPKFAAAYEMRMTAWQKYQETARLYADKLAKEGLREDGIEVIKRVYADAKVAELPVAALDKETHWMLESLEDGVSYENALSPKHLEAVSEVKRLFVLADSYVQMGLLDQANKSYQQIIALDPYNEAARRGLEMVSELIRNYYDAATDEARSQMLTRVESMWENPVPRYSFSHLPNFEGLGGENPAEEDSVQAKLNSLLLPQVSFEETPLREVLFFLNQRSIDLDLSQSDPSKRGVNIVLSVDDAGAGDTPISLTLRDIPIGVVIDYVAQLAGMKFRIDGHAVVLARQGSLLDETMFTRRYRVPPTFLSKSGGAAGGGGGDPFGATPDPFGDLDGGGRNAVLKARLTPEDQLKNSGVAFPPGSSVKYFPETSTLLVRNTRMNLEFIETLVEQSYGSITKMLKITVKQIEITESDLEEIGFEWLLDQFNLGSSERIFGGGGTNGSTSQTPGAAASVEFPFIPPNSQIPLGRLPVSGGIRTANALTAFPGTGAGATRTASTFAIGGVFTDPQFQTVIRAMQQKGGEDLLSAGTVVTLAGQQASVRVVREFMYPSEYDPPEVPSTVGSAGIGNNTTLIGNTNFAPIVPAHPTAFEMREVGSIVEVEGTIGANGLINLTISPEIVRFEGFIDYGSNITQFESDLTTGAPFISQQIDNPILQPIFFTNRVTTNVDVFDGETILIGGLLADRNVKVSDGIPGLQHIPLFGRLFKTEIQDRSRVSLMFFVTVNLVDPAGNTVREVPDGPFMTSFPSE